MTGAEHGAWVWQRQWQLRAMTPEQLAEVDEAHRASGYGQGTAAPEALSAATPVGQASGPWVTCARCGMQLPAEGLDEHDARAVDLAVWSLCRARLDTANTTDLEPT